MEDREVELIDYLRVLWRQRAIIAVTFLAAVLAVWFINTRLPETYSAKTSLLLLPPLASDLKAAASGSTLTSQVCQRLATSTEILRAVAADIGLPPDTDIQAFSQRVSLSVQAFAMSGEQQFLLDASFTAPEPETSAQMARAWIAAFSTTYEGLFQDRTTQSYDYISENAASTQQELESAMAKRTALLLEHPIDFLTSDIKALQSRYQDDVTELAASRREFDSNGARIAALEHELAQQTSVVVLERSLNPDALAIALQSGLSNRAFDELLGLRTQVESENQTFVSLTSDAAYARATSVELANRIETLAVAVADERAELNTKQKEAIETQAALDALNSEVRLLQDTHARIATKLQDALIALAETSRPIRVIDAPAVPTGPISPGTARSVAVAGFLGLLLGVALAFFFDYLNRVRKLAEKTQVAKPPEPGRDNPSAPVGKSS
jgi:uncharacterized protein involved in exopolysaccharide biosynthesis